MFSRARMLASLEGTAPSGQAAPMLGSQRLLRSAAEMSRNVYAWLKAKREVQLRSKRLLVAETVSLGEKRFVSIVKVDGMEFLVGGSASNVCLLTELKQRPDAEDRFPETNEETCSRPGRDA